MIKHTLNTILANQGIETNVYRPKISLQYPLSDFYQFGIPNIQLTEQFQFIFMIFIFKVIVESYDICHMKRQFHF